MGTPKNTVYLNTNFVSLVWPPGSSELSLGPILDLKNVLLGANLATFMTIPIFQPINEHIHLACPYLAPSSLHLKACSDAAGYSGSRLIWFLELVGA